MSKLTPESKVKSRVKVVLATADNLYGWWPVPAGYGENSLDYVGCHRGQFFAIETKAPLGKPSALQERCAERIRSANGTVFIIDGTDRHPIQPLIDWLNRREP